MNIYPITLGQDFHLFWARGYDWLKKCSKVEIDYKYELIWIWKNDYKVEIDYQKLTGYVISLMWPQIQKWLQRRNWLQMLTDYVIAQMWSKSKKTTKVEIDQVILWTWLQI